MATQARGRPLEFHTSQWEGMVFRVWGQSVRRITDTSVLLNRRAQRASASGAGSDQVEAWGRRWGGSSDKDQKKTQAPRDEMKALREGSDTESRVSNTVLETKF